MNDINSKIREEPILISIEQACKYTSIGRNTMLKLVKMRGFPALVFPHKILIDKTMLPMWLRQNYGRYKN